jgi:hypothetical protein
MLSPELAAELREARPLASPELRERVREIATRERPAQPPRFWLPSLRQVALVGAPAVLAVAVGIALVHGLLNAGSRSAQRATVKAHVGSGAATARQRAIQRQPLTNPKATSEDLRSRFDVVPVSPGRLEQYGAYMRIQVKNLDSLSGAMQHAMRFARDVGGYVAYVRYASPKHGQGAAALIVRVPIDRVQDVIQEYSNLGTIVSQKVSVLDVTKAVEEEAREIARLKAEIAKLEAGGVTPDERYRLEALQARLDYLTKRKATTVRRAQLARVALELTTKPKAAASGSGRFDRTMSDAGGVLLREGEILLYALIVAGPLLLLGGAVIVAGRFRDRRLFERS